MSQAKLARECKIQDAESISLINQGTTLIIETIFSKYEDVVSVQAAIDARNANAQHELDPKHKHKQMVYSESPEPESHIEVSHAAPPSAIKPAHEQKWQAVGTRFPITIPAAPAPPIAVPAAPAAPIATPAPCFITTLGPVLGLPGLNLVDSDGESVHSDGKPKDEDVRDPANIAQADLHANTAARNIPSKTVQELQEFIIRRLTDELESLLRAEDPQALRNVLNKILNNIRVTNAENPLLSVPKVNTLFRPSLMHPTSKVDDNLSFDNDLPLNVDTKEEMSGLDEDKEALRNLNQAYLIEQDQLGDVVGIITVNYSHLGDFCIYYVQCKQRSRELYKAQSAQTFNLWTFAIPKQVVAPAVAYPEYKKEQDSTGFPLAREHDPVPLQKVLNPRACWPPRVHLQTTDPSALAEQYHMQTSVDCSKGCCRSNCRHLGRWCRLLSQVIDGASGFACVRQTYTSLTSAEVIPDDDLLLFLKLVGQTHSFKLGNIHPKSWPFSPEEEVLVLMMDTSPDPEQVPADPGTCFPRIRPRSQVSLQ
ncbi:hypothetical protein BT96DRAFT_1073530 [Gymnopus androsaceus JB14]|uniref:Uncharacterized protein n=1 Tax=Gymnopus androsaceus JB14 TaxID=1447944 RepID=A0A6A4GSU7_9AGAR|nr:hypothetical protein BT96DRAFT_1073530 [Gymnopus androsaceus JB14]